MVFFIIRWKKSRLRFVFVMAQLSGTYGTRPYRLSHLQYNLDCNME